MSSRPVRGSVRLELRIAVLLVMLLLAGAALLLARDWAGRLRAPRDSGDAALAAGFDLLGRELRLAGNYGLTVRGDLIRAAATGAGGAAAAAVGNSCGPGVLLDLAHPVTAVARGGAPLPCASLVPDAGSDLLIIRRAGARSRDDGTVRVLSERLGGTLLAPHERPWASASAEIRDLVVEVFYVARRDRAGLPGAVPGLRRVRLAAGPDGAPRMKDELVVPGVRQLGVELGVELGDSGGVNAYVPAGASVPAESRVIAVRLTLAAGEGTGAAARGGVHTVYLRNAGLR